MQEVLEGKTLGHYQLQRRIGQGGMSEVYLASDEHLHRDVAVKIVHRERTEDLARFQREVETLALLTHEHILPVYDYGQDGPWHYLVMAYISHGTLADRLSLRGPFTPVEANVLFEQVASALQYAHNQGVLHRDIKPSNILLRDDTYAYLADFGIAKFLERESGLTQTGTFIGTPEYMAPELFESQASQASDIYALGIVLYDMLTGRLPFTGPNPISIVQKQFHEPPMPPSQLNPAIAPSVEQVVLRSLAKDPQRRFQSASAFANAYRSALQLPTEVIAQPINMTPGFYAETTVAVRQPSFPPPGSQPASRPAASGPSKRRRRTLALIALGLFVLFLMLGSALLVGLALGYHTNTSSPTVDTTAATTVSTLTSTPTQLATTCVVNDSAGILDQDQICQQARSLSYSLVVNTSSASQGENTAYAPQTGSGDENTIVINIVINPSRHGHPQPPQVTITGGSAVPLTTEQYHSAVEAFNQAAHNGDYTSATIAAIQSLQTSGA